jgi:hypothetical protein
MSKQRSFAKSVAIGLGTAVFFSALFVILHPNPWQWPGVWPLVIIGFGWIVIEAITPSIEDVILDQAGPPALGAPVGLGYRVAAGGMAVLSLAAVIVSIRAYPADGSEPSGFFLIVGCLAFLIGFGYVSVSGRKIA